MGSSLADTLERLARTLDGLGVRWYVFGAQAVNAYARPRTTQDVDVTVEWEGAVSRLIAALHDAGLEFRFEGPAEAFFAGTGVLPLREVATGRDVDVVLAGAGLETLALGRARRRALLGVEVPVISPTDLVVVKVLAGRPKDLEDVRAVLSAAPADVDLAEARDLLRQLEEALDRSDLVPELDRAVAETLEGG